LKENTVDGSSTENEETGLGKQKTVATLAVSMSCGALLI